MTVRDEYIKKLKADLDEWKADLDTLEAEAEIKHEGHIKELRQKLEEAQQTLTKIHDGSEDTWEDLKQRAETVWNMYKNSFKKAKSEFKRGYREGVEE
ncbi:MAG: hypothetical protein MUO68_12185, partial [Desulfobacteraceae bacterium]|nr:hypothetical protein [Desulfobacteraceae bacterium]